jgi:putative phosphotransacetylase
MAADDKEAVVRAVTAAVMAKLGAGGSRTFEAPVGVSGPHIHLTPGDVATLFGAGARLSVMRPLVQCGQFAANEAVTIVGPASSLSGVRVVGPTRASTVAELLAGDLVRLGLDPDVRAGEPFAVTVAGPAGVVHLPAGGVVARRHLHVPAAAGGELGVADGTGVSARMGAPGRRVTFHDVLVRVSPEAGLELHVDREEANACGVRTGDAAEILIGAAVPAASGMPARAAGRPLVTEEDVVRAHAEGREPRLAGAILTPYARDAVRKLVPELLNFLE